MDLMYHNDDQKNMSRDRVYQTRELDDELTSAAKDRDPLCKKLTKCFELTDASCARRGSRIAAARCEICAT